jgi:putative GTP pyrophosphokinase
VSELQDLVGLRLVVPFTRDLESVRKAIVGACRVIRQYDTVDQLRDDQFGYRASHYVVTPRDPTELDAWSFPVLAEIQVKTSSQHLWAEASHILQYKSEVAPPPELRRAIHRVAALLEGVDLEFERVLQARDLYRKEVQIADDDAVLNVDLLAVALPRLWPSEHQGPVEVLDGLLHALDRKGISTLGQLRLLIAEQRSAVFRDSLAHANEILDVVANGTKNGDAYTITTSNGSKTVSGVGPELIDRARRGIFYSLSGLTFTALQFASGEGSRYKE